MTSVIYNVGIHVVTLFKIPQILPGFPSGEMVTSDTWALQING